MRIPAPASACTTPGTTSVAAIVSKRIFRTRTANVFNPAALAVVASYYVFHTGQSWWVALVDVFPLAKLLLIAGGIYIADRVNKMPLVLAFLGSYFALFTIAAFVREQFPQTRCVIEQVGKLTATVKHPIGPDDLRPGGTVRGGIMMEVADVALYIAILGEIGIVPLTVTTSLNINFLRKPSATRSIVGICKLIKVGQALAVGAAFGLGEADGDHLGGVIPLVDCAGDVEAFVALQADQPPAQGGGQHLGDLGLADSGLAFEEDRPLHAQREEQHGGERTVGQIAGGCEKGERLVDGCRQCGHVRAFHYWI